MLLKVNQNLKQDAVGRAAAHTHAGMAHFAGTGPAGKTCRECSLWRFEGYKKTDRKPKNGACEKGLGARFVYNALACKYFEQNETPPVEILKEQS
jgi:hypothetical protein